MTSTVNINDDLLVMIASDRLSAFDVILPTPIPQKGEILTAISNFWFKRFKYIIPNHLSELKLSDIISNETERAAIKARCMVVKKVKALPIEAIVRGYDKGAELDIISDGRFLTNYEIRTIRFWLKNHFSTFRVEVNFFYFLFVLKFFQNF